LFLYSCSVPPVLLLQICIQRKYCLHRREYLANIDRKIYFWFIRVQTFFFPVLYAILSLFTTLIQMMD
jgi:hypothetical protein